MFLTYSSIKMSKLMWKWLKQEVAYLSHKHIYMRIKEVIAKWGITGYRGHSESWCVWLRPFNSVYKFWCMIRHSPAASLVRGSISTKGNIYAMFIHHFIINHGKVQLHGQVMHIKKVRPFFLGKSCTTLIKIILC